MTEATYPTPEAWDFFSTHQGLIRTVCQEYLPKTRMEIPNTRIAIVNPDGSETVTWQRVGHRLPPRFTLMDFDKAVAEKDTRQLMHIMSNAWLRLPESRGVYQIPGVGPMCHLLEFGVSGFVPEEPADGDEAED